ncbi:MAG: hypothetical protein HXY29_00390 [Rhodocyclaceae bacterium]|nr:hypothetical protein [Rhodocyclaceae bacterium]
MDTQRAMEISALIDGEVEEHEVREAIRASLDDPERWRTYLLIGEAMRGETAPRLDLTEAVMARLAEEPVVLAPRNLRERRPRHHPLLALAASVAGVAVVGWVALTGAPQPIGSETKLVTAGTPSVMIASAVPPAPPFRNESAPGGTPAIPPAPTLSNAVPTASADMQEYLLAHQAQAATVRLGEAARQIRTVALTATHP